MWKDTGASAGLIDLKVVRSPGVWSCTQCKGTNLHAYAPTTESHGSAESGTHLHGAAGWRIYFSIWRYSASAVKLKKI